MTPRQWKQRQSYMRNNPHNYCYAMAVETPVLSDDIFNKMTSEQKDRYISLHINPPIIIPDDAYYELDTSAFAVNALKIPNPYLNKR